MNPREQACAEVEDARARHDTRKQHRATRDAYRVTHDILGYPMQARKAAREADVLHASTAPAAARAGNLFSRTFARIWGRS